MLLKDKRVIVTGGASGIGRATVVACAREGANVVSLSTAAPERSRVRALMAEVEAMGAGRLTHLQVDVSDKAAVDRGFDEAAAWLGGGLDGLVNSAAIQAWKPAEAFTKDEILEDMAVNTFGAVYANQAAFRFMKDTGGSIVNLISYVAIGGQEMMAGYGLSKGAVIGWSHVIAREWGPRFIRVNMVAPIVETTGFQNYYRQLTPEKQRLSDLRRQQTISLGGKMGSSGDAADVNVFLLSDLSRYLTGQTLYADGGASFSR
jgi:NAD(P)-dependent dehydrogenase (short-subunit alcohol dehydrogenase family)